MNRRMDPHAGGFSVSVAAFASATTILVGVRLIRLAALQLRGRRRFLTAYALQVFCPAHRAVLVAQRSLA